MKATSPSSPSPLRRPPFGGTWPLAWRLARTYEVARANLPQLDGLMADHADAVAWVRPRGGMTGFPRLVSGGDARDFCHSAITRGVLLAPGDCWGVTDHFRIGFGVSAEWFPLALERFAVVLREWPHSPAARMALQ